MGCTRWCLWYEYNTSEWLSLSFYVTNLKIHPIDQVISVCIRRQIALAKVTPWIANLNGNTSFKQGWSKRKWGFMTIFPHIIYIFLKYFFKNKSLKVSHSAGDHYSNRGGESAANDQGEDGGQWRRLRPQIFYCESIKQSANGGLVIGCSCLARA